MFELWHPREWPRLCSGATPFAKYICTCEQQASGHETTSSSHCANQRTRAREPRLPILPNCTLHNAHTCGGQQAGRHEGARVQVVSAAQHLHQRLHGRMPHQPPRFLRQTHHEASYIACRNASLAVCCTSHCDSCSISLTVHTTHNKIALSGAVRLGQAGYMLAPGPGM